MERQRWLELVAAVATVAVARRVRADLHQAAEGLPAGPVELRMPQLAEHPELQLAEHPELQLAEHPAQQPAEHPELQLVEHPELQPVEHPELQPAGHRPWLAEAKPQEALLPLEVPAARLRRLWSHWSAARIGCKRRKTR